MRTERTPFAPLIADIDDDRIEQLAREKGVGTFRPAKADESSAEISQREIPHNHQPSENSAEEEGSPSPRPTPRSRMKKVNLELPDYVWTELKIRAAKQQASVRHLVMKALRLDGLTIAEVDMVEDGRRER